MAKRNPKGVLLRAMRNRQRQATIAAQMVEASRRAPHKSRDRRRNLLRVAAMEARVLLQELRTRSMAWRRGEPIMRHGSRPRWRRRQVAQLRAEPSKWATP